MDVGKSRLATYLGNLISSGERLGPPLAPLVHGFFLWHSDTAVLEEVKSDL